MKRVVFVIAGIICAAAVADAQRAAAGTETGGYEVIANASGFKIDIPGCADASKNIREIAIDRWKRLTSLPAIKTGRIHSVDGNLMHRYGPRVIDGLDQLARAIHPEAFR